MATKARVNGQSKTETTTAKSVVQKKLAQQATGKKTTSIAQKTSNVPGTSKPLEVIVNLDQRINNFEKLRGIANQRERLTATLSELTKFNYNQDGSSTFFLRDAAGLEFKTMNSNLIQLVTNQLQRTLEVRKAELEKELIEFEL